MADLISIPGIGKASLQLLEAAGFHDVEALAKTGASELAHELTRANRILKVSKRTPGKATLKKWIAEALARTEIPGPAEAPVLQPVNYEQSPQVAALLVSAPFAIPLPAAILIENQLGVPDIPVAILLNRYAGDLDVRVEQLVPVNRPVNKAAVPNSYVRLAESGHARVEIDTSRMRSTQTLEDGAPQAAASVPTAENDRMALIRAPLAATNQGIDPLSRWYIRGVLHSEPFSIFFGAIITLVLMILIPTSMLAAAALLLSAEVPDHFAWVPKGLLAFPAALPVLGFAYLIFGLKCHCRVCGQKLFVHHRHLKNSKAHRAPGLGYILPLCIHILLFRWFRCTHCGTAIRVKQ
jgi:hypothetical protein